MYTIYIYIYTYIYIYILYKYITYLWVLDGSLAWVLDGPLPWDLEGPLPRLRGASAAQLPSPADLWES